MSQALPDHHPETAIAHPVQDVRPAIVHFYQAVLYYMMNQIKDQAGKTTMQQKACMQ